MFDTMIPTLLTEADEIPDGLDEMKPGPFLALFLSSIDVNAVSGHDRVVVMKARQRMASHYQAGVYGDMASVSDYMEGLDDDVELANEAAAAEIRVALSLTRRSADHELSTALTLKERLPVLWYRFHQGDLDLRRVKTIVHGTEHLSAEVAQAVVEEILPEASELTTGQIGARLRRLCVEVDPDDARSRFENAVDERRVVMQPTVDGTADLLGLHLQPDRAAAAADRINKMAQNLKTADEPRTIDQIRADVYLDILQGVEGDGVGRRGVVNIVTDLETLARLADHPGDLAGYGPVIADIARQVAESGHNQFQYSVVDSASGDLVHSGVTRRRPTAETARFVKNRQSTCVFKGCRMPSEACDLDHRKLHAEGGEASAENLDPLCRRDHVIRHQFGWTHERLPDGTIKWTSRLGHIYATRPENLRSSRWLDADRADRPEGLGDPDPP